MVCVAGDPWRPCCKEQWLTVPDLEVVCGLCCSERWSTVPDLEVVCGLCCREWWLTVPDLKVVCVAESGV